MENNELQHHGTKGMRWGIRRYQNPDGSLTAAGRKRYGVEGAKGSATKKSAKVKKPEVETPKKKSVSEMSDKELRDAITRSQLEAQYRQYNPERVSTGKQFMRRLRDEAIIPAAISSGRKFLENSLNKMIDDKFGDKSADNIAALKKTYEKLDLQTKIDKLKNPDKYESWDDKQKRRAYEDETARREAEAKAEAKTKAAEARKEHNADPAVNEFVRKTNPDIGSSDRRQSSAEKAAGSVNKYTIDMEYEPSGQKYVRSNPVDTTPSKQTIDSGSSYINNLLQPPKDDD